MFAVDDAINCLNNYLLAFEHVQTWTNGKLNSIKNNKHLIANWLCSSNQTNDLARRYCGIEAADAFNTFFEQIDFGFFTMFIPIDGYD